MIFFPEAVSFAQSLAFIFTVRLLHFYMKLALCMVFIPFCFSMSFLTVRDGNTLWAIIFNVLDEEQVQKKCVKNKQATGKH